MEMKFGPSSSETPKATATETVEQPRMPVQLVNEPQPVSIEPARVVRAASEPLVVIIETEEVVTEIEDESDYKSQPHQEAESLLKGVEDEVVEDEVEDEVDEEVEADQVEVELEVEEEEEKEQEEQEFIQEYESMNQEPEDPTEEDFQAEEELDQHRSMVRTKDNDGESMETEREEVEVDQEYSLQQVIEPTEAANCQFCSEPFETKVSLLDHYAADHQDETYNCTNCQKLFNSLNEWRSHLCRRPKRGKRVSK